MKSGNVIDERMDRLKAHVEHQEKKTLEDSVTGLVIEARCICKHGDQ